MGNLSAKHIQWLKQELPALKADGIVSEDTAQAIESYYAEKTNDGLHWAVIAFAVLGSLLIGAGIILLLAHNWDELDRPVRAVLSLCPILIGSILSITALIKNGGTALRESAGIFHTLSIGATIALIGQTYHLPGNVPGFFMTWTLLALPLTFLLRSSGAALLYLALACGWSGVAQETYGQAAGFWLLILPGLARLAYLIRTDRHTPETLLNLWGMLIALCIATGMTFERTLPGLWIIAYSALLSGTGVLGIQLYNNQTGWNNPAKIFGIAGITILAYIFTFEHAWFDIGWAHMRSGWQYRAWGVWMDGGITGAFLLFWLIIALKTISQHTAETLTLSVFPLAGILCFILGSIKSTADTVNALIFNGFMLFLGIMYIGMGCRNGRLSQLNGGMAVLSLLLVTRFFDEDFGFIARGTVFIILGTCFLVVNLIMIKRRKKQEAIA